MQLHWIFYTGSRPAEEVSMRSLQCWIPPLFPLLCWWSAKGVVSCCWLMVIGTFFAGLSAELQRSGFHHPTCPKHSQCPGAVGRVWLVLREHDSGWRWRARKAELRGWHKSSAFILLPKKTHRWTVSSQQPIRELAEGYTICGRACELGWSILNLSFVLELGKQPSILPLLWV